jgi:hypothetical protein
VTRLPFRLSEFAPRISWASVLARETWAPRIAAISNAWLVTERDLVAKELRPSALQSVHPDNLASLIREEASRGLVVLALGQVARATGYQSATQAITGAWDYRCAITQPGSAREWAAAWNTGDNDAIGRLLGYPSCCREFFQRIWVEEKWFDTTVPMALLPSPHSHGGRFAPGAQGQPAPSPRMCEPRSGESHDDGEGTEVRGINTLWRWLGVRPVSHLPCSFDCEPSLVMGREANRLMTERFPDEALWLCEILAWPVKYTSLRGIAELTTPVCRMSVPTDALAERVEIRYLGAGYPAEGAKGLGFPFRTDVTQPITIQIGRPSAQNPAVNGFSSLIAMQAAHNRLLEAVGPGPYQTVVDLGCGDGMLLSRVPAKRRVGVEFNSEACDQAAKRLDRVVRGDCTRHNFVQALLQHEKPDLVIAQRDRNPAETLTGYRVLSYSYEGGAAPPQLIETG